MEIKNDTSTPPSLVSVIIPTHNRRDEVAACVRSVLASSYSTMEVIVVDNASDDGTCECLAREFGDRIRLIRSDRNLFAGGGRNLGAGESKGDYLLFVDSDNVVDRDMVAELVAGASRSMEREVGMAGPFMCYAEQPDNFCWTGGGEISPLTSRTRWEGVGVKDIGQFRDMPFVSVGHIPNVFMVPRRVWDEIGGIDPDYAMHYEESDLAERIRLRGYGIVLFPRARTCHRIPVEKPGGDKQFQGVDRNLLYYSARNRVLFMRKNSRGWRLAIFLALFGNLFLAYSVAMLAWNRRFGLIPVVWRGHVAGYATPLRIPGSHGRRN